MPNLSAEPNLGLIGSGQVNVTHHQQVTGGFSFPQQDTQNLITSDESHTHPPINRIGSMNSAVSAGNNSDRSDPGRQPNSISNLRVYVALYDYEARTDEDLSFRKGEHLEILNDTQVQFFIV